jgi:hypothetical protein
MTLEHVSKSASIGVPKGNAWVISVVPSRYCPRIPRWVIRAPALGPGDEMVVNDKDLNKGSMRPASEDPTACPYSRAGLLQLDSTLALRQSVQLLLQPRKVSYERCAVSDMTHMKPSISVTVLIALRSAIGDRAMLMYESPTVSTTATLVYCRSVLPAQPEAALNPSVLRRRA